MSKKINRSMRRDDNHPSLIDLAKAGKWDKVKKIITKLPAMEIRLAEEMANPAIDLLEYATLQNNMSVVKMLLNKKDYTDLSGVLSMAAKTIRFHYNDIAKVLVDYLSQFVPGVNTVFDKGPLMHIATWSRNTEMLKYLISHGADPNLKGSSRMRPLHVACKYNEYPAFEILLSHPNIRVNVHSSPLGMTPLFEAAAVGNQKMVIELINAGANPNGLLYSGINLLGTDELVKNHNLRRFMLSLGINVNQVGPFSDNMVNVVLARYRKQNTQSNSPTHDDLVIYLEDLLPIMDPVLLNSQNFYGWTTLDYILSLKLWLNPKIKDVLKKITWDIFSPDTFGESIYEKTSQFDKYHRDMFIEIMGQSYLHSIHEAVPGERSRWEKECENMLGKPREDIIRQFKQYKLKVSKDLSKEDACMLLAKYQIEKKRKSYAGTRIFEYFKKIDLIIKPTPKFTPVIWRGLFAWEWLLNKYIIEKHPSKINNHFPTLKEFLKPVDNVKSLDAVFAFVWTRENGKEELIPPFYLRARDLRKKGLKQFSLFPFIITYLEHEGHENSIIIDHVNKTVERFEPHGYKGAHYYNTRQLTIELKKYFRKILPEYTFLDSKTIYPRRGVQTYEHIPAFHDISYEFKPGYCAAWSAWYMDLIVTNWDIIDKFRTRQEFINAALVKIHQQFSSAQKYILMYIEHTKVYQKLEKIVEAVPFFANSPRDSAIDFATTSYLHIDPNEGDSPENKAAIQFRKLLYSAKMK